MVNGSVMVVHDNQLDNGCDQNIVVYNSECLVKLSRSVRFVIHLART
jgi:hypothetical protein